MQKWRLVVHLHLSQPPRGEISAAKCRCTLCHHLVATFHRRWSPARRVYLGIPEIQPHAVAENEVCGSKFDQSSSETCYTTVESYRHVWLCARLFWKAAKRSFAQEIFERFNIFFLATIGRSAASLDLCLWWVGETGHRLADLGNLSRI